VDTDCDMKIIMAKRKTFVTKYSGDTELFDVEKLRNSLKKSGAPDHVVDEIIDHIMSELYQGMNTAQIYSHAYQLLKKHGGSHAAMYDLRKALSRLGPSGYPFEAFVGSIFEHLGYEVQLGAQTQGRLITHDVDVLATKRGEVNMMECKYHREDQTKVNSKTAMYVSARYADIRERFESMKGNSKKTLQPWLVTNTKFTKDAIAFAEGWRLRLLGWGYPKDQGLEKMIEKAGLHPITCLTSLNHDEMGELLQNKIVLCRRLHDDHVQRMLKLKGGRLDRLKEEIGDLCGVDNEAAVKMDKRGSTADHKKFVPKFDF
jgi:hypothetical protein